MTTTDVTRVSDQESAPTTHARLLAWVREVAELTQPDAVHWVDGSQAEWLRRHGARVPEPGARTDEDWRLARLLDEGLNWRVVIADR